MRVEGYGIHVKMLIPARIAGIVIGKGGSNICKLQEESNSRIKISKSHELFPGTEERVCLINGDVHSILQVYDRIQDTFKARPDALNTDLSSDRINEVQILVPNTTAGLLIGRGGSNIRQIGQETGAKIVISQRVDGVPERLVIIASNSDSARRLAFSQVISKVADDPRHDSCADIFYTQPIDPESPPIYHKRRQTSHFNPEIAPTDNPIEIVERLLTEAGGLNHRTADVLVSIMQERFEFSGDAAMDVLRAVDCLIKYGLLSFRRVNNQAQFNHDRQMSPQLHMTEYHNSGMPHRRHVQIKVPSHAVGPLVGTGGRNLVALESQCDGARIHISPRDDRNPERIVTIEAPTSSALERAVELINDVMAREDARVPNVFG